MYYNGWEYGTFDGATLSYPLTHADASGGNFPTKRTLAIGTPTITDIYCNSSITDGAFETFPTSTNCGDDTDTTLITATDGSTALTNDYTLTAITGGEYCTEKWVINKVNFDISSYPTIVETNVSYEKCVRI